jgi:hypothetical protein
LPTPVGSSIATKIALTGHQPAPAWNPRPFLGRREHRQRGRGFQQRELALVVGMSAVTGFGDRAWQFTAAGAVAAPAVLVAGQHRDGVVDLLCRVCDELLVGERVHLASLR